MSNNSANNKRIAKNTLLLYVRMLLLLVVQLYTAPIVLNALGVVDYGIYNVVGGVVTMFSFLGGMLASGSQRFLAFAMGKGDKQGLKQTFDTTVTIYLFFAIVAFVLLESVGVWFLNAKMNIPADRMEVANWVLQLSILAFLVNLVSIPYNAAIVAHEKMSVYAYISILECLLKLVVAITLQHVLFDKLIVYAVLICGIALLVRVIYQIYCRKYFEECRSYRFSWNMQTGKELLAYSGWNVIGYVANLSRQQGLNIVLNLFFGPMLNAAHSLAQQINGVLTQFINNFYVATRPQITKSYAANEVADMWRLVFDSSRLSFYLLMCLSIPLAIELDTILTVWLGIVPPYTVEITRLMIVSLLVETLANQVIAAYQAANKIRRYQLYSSTIILLNIPVSYILLRLTPTSPVLPYIVSIGLSVLYIVSILWNAKKEIGLNLTKYIKQVMLRVVVIYSIVMALVSSIISMLGPSLLRVLITILATLLFSGLVVWLIGLEANEKNYIKDIVKRKIFRK